jgi:hypothetical protein
MLGKVLLVPLLIVGSMALMVYFCVGVSYQSVATVVNRMTSSARKPIAKPD